MDFFYITYHKLSENILELNTKEKIADLENFNIILQDRFLKKDFIYQPHIINLENGYTNIKLNLSDIDFGNDNKNVLDLFFQMENKKIRAKSEFIHLKSKKSRYATNFHRINNSKVAVPYLTIHNNISILYGNASIVFDEYCENIDSPDFVNSIICKKDQSMSIEFSSITFDKNTTFLAFYDAENKSFVTISSTQDKENSNKLLIDLQKSSVHEYTIDNLVLQQKKRNILTTLKLNNQPQINTEETISNHELDFTEKPVIKSHLNIQNLNYRERKVSFELSNSLLVDAVKYDLYIKDTEDNIYTPKLKFQSLDNRTVIEVDLSKFIKLYAKENSKWDFYLSLEYKYYIEENRLGLYNSPYISSFKRYFNHKDTENYRFITPYLTISNGLSTIITSEIALYNRILKPIIEITNLKKESKRSYFIEVSLEFEEYVNYKVEALLLKYRNKTDNIEYSFDIDEQSKENNKSVARINIDTSNLRFEQYQWDVFLQISIKGNKYFIRVKNPITKLREDINNEENKYCIKLDKDFIFYPYITIHNGISFTYRKKEIYENFWQHAKERYAYFIYIFLKNRFDRKQIWLVYEKFSQTAQDNSFYFFKYMYENHPDTNVYYILDRNSSDYANVEEMKDRVIPFMSIKHFIYLFASKLFVSSEARGHSYILRKQNGRIKNVINSKKFYFLQHGVLGLKKVDTTFSKDSKHGATFFVTSSDWEADIVEKHFGYDKNEIAVTGLCRWDALVDKTQNSYKKEIMFMPTWRPWLDGISDEKFLESDYYRNYEALLNSEKLQKILQDNEIIINFNFHPKLKEYINKFKTDNDNIKIYQFGEEKINNLLMHSKLLITDYSSVAWDQYYQKKPVIFYQFDQNMYEQLQGSYMDMNTDLFGDLVFDVDQLIDTIETYVNRDFVEKTEYAAMREGYFKHIDRNNSKRNFKKIIQNKDYLDLE